MANVKKEDLPDFVRYVDENTGTFIIELPPRVRQILIRSDVDYDYYKPKHQRDQTTFQIPVPWQVYICRPRANHVQFFTRTAPLTSLSDTINYPHISNIYRDGQPCGGIPLSQQVATDDLERAVAHINYVWDSSFQGGFYLSAEGDRYGHHLEDGKKGNLLPKTMIKAMGGESPFYYGDHGGGSLKYYEWVEQLTTDDLLHWEWTEAGTLREVAKTPKGARLRARKAS